MELMIQYRVKPDMGDIQAEAITGFVANIAALGAGIRYRAYRFPDGVTFRHLASIKDEQTKALLQSQDFFKEFTQAMQPRCEEPPSVTPLALVASTELG